MLLVVVGLVGVLEQRGRGIDAEPSNCGQARRPGRSGGDPTARRAPMMAGTTARLAGGPVAALAGSPGSLLLRPAAAWLEMQRRRRCAQGQRWRRSKAPCRLLSIGSAEELAHPVHDPPSVPACGRAGRERVEAHKRDPGSGAASGADGNDGMCRGAGMSAERTDEGSEDPAEVWEGAAHYWNHDVIVPNHDPVPHDATAAMLLAVWTSINGCAISSQRCETVPSRRAGPGRLRADPGPARAPPLLVAPPATGGGDRVRVHRRPVAVATSAAGVAVAALALTVLVGSPVPGAHQRLPSAAAAVLHDAARSAFRSATVRLAPGGTRPVVDSTPAFRAEVIIDPGTGDVLAQETVVAAAGAPSS